MPSVPPRFPFLLLCLPRLWFVAAQVRIHFVPFSSLRGLKGLDLSSNNLDGTIPESFENLVNLEHLWLSNNRLTGKLPALGSWADLSDDRYLGQLQIAMFFFFSNSGRLLLPEFNASTRSTPWIHWSRLDRCENWTLRLLRSCWLLPS